MSTGPAAAGTSPSSPPGAGKRLESLPDLVVPFKRDAYVEIVAAFRDIPRQIAQLAETSDSDHA